MTPTMLRITTNMYGRLNGKVRSDMTLEMWLYLWRQTHPMASLFDQTVGAIAEVFEDQRQ